MPSQRPTTVVSGAILFNSGEYFWLFPEFENALIAQFYEDGFGSKDITDPIPADGSTQCFVVFDLEKRFDYVRVV